MVVGAGAIVLGAITIGDGARVAAGSVVVHDVPPGTTVVGVPGKISMEPSAMEVQDLEHGRLPDPIADTIRSVWTEQEKLRQRIERLELREGKSIELDTYLRKKKRESIEGSILVSKEFIEGEGI